MDLRELRLGNVDFIVLPQNRAKWRIFVYHSSSIKDRKFLDKLETVRFRPMGRGAGLEAAKKTEYFACAWNRT